MMDFQVRAPIEQRAQTSHPIQCLVFDKDADDDTDYAECGWCRDHKMVNTLTKFLEDQAIVVREGATLTLACDKIGYLAMYGGTIHQHNSLESVITNPPTASRVQ